MADAPITRRALVVAAGAALGTIALPAGISRAISVEEAPTGLPGVVPLAFDPGAYVDDLLAAGCSVMLVRDVAHTFNPHPRPVHVCIVPPGGRYSATSYLGVMAKWIDAMDDDPDHVERLVAHMVERPEQL